MTERKLEALRTWFRSRGSCVVAYSGGVDSAFLAFVAARELGDRSLAVLADSPSLPRRELEEAEALAVRFSIPLRIVRTSEFENPDYTANPVNRCFFCKQELFRHLVPLARSEGFSCVVYGENASDVGDYRPGALAAAEASVAAPLKEVGLTKAEIRELSAAWGLPTADKPEMPCLSSRIPYGQRVDPGKLSMVEAAENTLRDLGFREVRVRHHEAGGALARIELGPDELPRAMDVDVRTRITGLLVGLGYAHVTLDLRGYRRGSLNERHAAAVAGSGEA